MSDPIPDLLIVGGGAIGLSCAYAAAQRGLRVRLLEKESAAGTRASWAGAGMLNCRPFPKKDPAQCDYQDLVMASIPLHRLWAAYDTQTSRGFRIM